MRSIPWLGQGTPQQWSQFVSDYLPKFMFGQAKVQVEDYVFKREILEDVGQTYTADHEAVNINYTVEFCSGHSQYIAGMAYVGTSKGSIVLVTDYRPECLDTIAAD